MRVTKDTARCVLEYTTYNGRDMMRRMSRLWYRASNDLRRINPRQQPTVHIIKVDNKYALDYRELFIPIDELRQYYPLICEKMRPGDIVLIFYIWDDGMCVQLEIYDGEKLWDDWTYTINGYTSYVPDLYTITQYPVNYWENIKDGPLHNPYNVELDNIQKQLATWQRHFETFVGLTGAQLIGMNQRSKIFAFPASATVFRPAVEFWWDFKHYCAVFADWEYHEPEIMPQPSFYIKRDIESEIKQVKYFKTDYWTLSSPEYDYVLLLRQ